MHIPKKRRLCAGLAALALHTGALCAATVPAQAATEGNFIVKNTADLVALCSAGPSTDNYVAAIHFCEGFGVGAYQYYLAQAGQDPGSRYVCLPNPPPTRDSIKTAFVAWTKANPSALDDTPVNSLFKYLGQTYPCPAK